MNKLYHMSIFKAYDIRGVVPSEFNSDLAEKIGRAYADWLHNEYPDEEPLHIALAVDNRISSPEIKEALMRGVTAGGIDIIDIGLAPTPVFYFAVNSLDLDGGLMVTASHNPPQFNGVKMVMRHALPLSGDYGIGDIEKMVAQELPSPVDQPGAILKKDILPAYVEKMLAEIPPVNCDLIPFVVDTGNGVSVVMVEALLQKKKLAAQPLFFELDGSFPNRMPDPLVPENIVHLQKEVIAKKARFGVALDADGDRIVFIDENGQSVQSDLMAALVAPYFLKKYPKAAIVYDIRSSWIVPEIITEHGGKPVISRVGHSFIKPLMKEHHAVFGAEISGHFYFRDGNGTYEMPLLMLLATLNILAESGKSLSELIAPLKKYFHSGEHNFHVEKKLEIIEKLKTTYANAKNVSILDGIRIEFEDWWFNVRPSNTENILRLNLEATSAQLRDQKLEEIRTIIEGI